MDKPIIEFLHTSLDYYKNPKRCKVDYRITKDNDVIVTDYIIFEDKDFNIIQVQNLIIEKEEIKDEAVKKARQEL